MKTGSAIKVFALAAVGALAIFLTVKEDEVIKHPKLDPRTAEGFSDIRKIENDRAVDLTVGKKEEVRRLLRDRLSRKVLPGEFDTITKEAVEYGLLDDPVIGPHVASWISLLPLETVLLVLEKWPSNADPKWRAELWKNLRAHVTQLPSLELVSGYISRLPGGFDLELMLQIFGRQSQLAVEITPDLKKFVAALNPGLQGQFASGLSSRIRHLEPDDRLPELQRLLDADLSNIVQKQLVSETINYFPIDDSFLKWAGEQPPGIADSLNYRIVGKLSRENPQGAQAYMASLGWDGNVPQVGPLVATFAAGYAVQHPVEAANWAISLPATYGKYRDKAIVDTFIPLQRRVPETEFNRLLETVDSANAVRQVQMHFKALQGSHRN